MPGSLILTDAWIRWKNIFLNRHDFKPQVEAYLGKLIRLMNSGQPWAVRNDLAFYSITTKLPHAQYSSLACVCAVNSKTGDYAPAALYFPGAKQSESMDGIAQALEDVRKELGWE